MVEPARGTKASAHGPWGVYATAWELGWATNTPLQSCTALPTPYSTAQMRCQECRIVVCAQSSAARAAMGHWGNYPHTPGMAGHCLVTLGGHTHTSTTTFGVAHTWPTLYSVRIAQCGSGAVRWCAHHLQQLGPQWGIGGNAPTPQGWQDTPWSPSGGTHTPPQPLSALPTPYSTARIAVRVSFGGVHTIFSS